MKKLFALMLAVLMLVCIWTACNTPEGPTDGTGASTADTNGTAGTDGDETSDLVYKADVPEKDYDGREFIIMCRDEEGAWGEWAIVDDGPAPGLIDDATYRRNLAVKDALNITFDYYEILDPSKTTNGLFQQALQANELANDYICDLSVPGCTDVAVLSATGMFLDLQEVPYIDLSAPWWQQKLNESVKVQNKQYFAINDMLLNDKLDTYAMFFNKDVLDANQLEYPYELVYKNEWTFEVFYQYFRGFGQDLNNDGVKDLTDQYGLVTFVNDVFFVSSGITAATLDPNTGIPEITPFSEKMADIFDYIVKIQGTNTFDVWNRKVQKGSYTDYQAVFDGKSMFMNTALSGLQDISANYESNCGLVPIPKMDADQDGYISRAGYGGATGVAILRSCPDVEFSAIVCEVLAAESKNIISPAFYDTLLSVRYAEGEDVEMIKLIIDSEIFDLDQIYKWGNLLISFSDAANNNGTDAASAYESRYSTAVQKLEAYLEKLESVE